MRWRSRPAGSGRSCRSPLARSRRRRRPLRKAFDRRCRLHQAGLPMNQQALRKTFDRTRRFVVEGLLWQGAGRAYAAVVWALLAGLLWLVLDLLNVGSTAWPLL